MSKLRNILKSNLCYEKANAKNYTMKAEYEAIVIDKLEEDIKQEIILEEAERVIEAEEKERTIRNIDRLKEAFWTVVIIGVLVGVTGNQVTELISCVKPDKAIVLTLLLSMVLIVIMYIYFWITYLRQATDEIEKFKEKK